MKMKKIVALLLAACMLVSTPVMATDTTTTEVVVEQTEGSNREAAIADEDGKAFVETTEAEETVHGEFFTPVEVEETEAPARENELKNNEISAVESQPAGVITADDAMVVENKQEVDTTVVKDELTKIGDYKVESIDREEINVDLGKDAEEAEALLNEQTVSEDDIVDVIIIMDDESVIEKDSDATMNWLTKIQIAIMEAKQNSVVSKIEKKALDGEEIEIRYQYTWLLNGIATKVPYGAIDDIEAIDGVKDVLLEMVYDACDATVDPYTVADGVMIGREDTWASGYTGKGIKIAIVDTGLDTDHQNFGALSDDKLTEESATKNTISPVLGSLNANYYMEYVNGRSLTVDDVYLNTKVAYGFNYVDANTTFDHSRDQQGDHGTHVAGIAAANDLNNGEAVGVAPDAQLYVMKVFGANGGAYTSDLLAALEDALILDADVVNMSLGSPAGFTSDGPSFDAIYGRVDETNTILTISAGNSTTAGIGNIWGTDTNLASNPDNSVVSSPATYVNVTSVASVENVGVKGYYMETEGSRFSYSDGNGNQPQFLTLAGKSYDYVMVPNCGQTAEDFAAVDVAGKIAVVQRGVTAFTEKHQLAQDAGAVACLIYNNVSGTIGLDLSLGTATIPCASITMADGEFLAYAKAQNADAKIFVSADAAIAPNPDAYKMSDFSSWGVSPDLKLEPDITGPGGNIYSTLDGGKYGIMSGTSMSSPNVAGIAALVMQYAKATYPEMTDAELHNFVNRLLVSTATPLSFDETADYSPRSQGSGLANAYDAINTRAYLTIDGMEVAKAELGDDVAKTGSYKYSFDVVNFGNETLYYNLDTTAQSEGVLDYGIYFMSTTPVALPATTTETSADMVGTYDYNSDKVANTLDARAFYLDVLAGEELDETGAVRYDLNETGAVDVADVQAYLDALVGKNDIDANQQTLVVEAGKTATVNVSVKLADVSKQYMDTYFENGIYVEGFTKLTAMNSAVDLSLPYLAFYGDWTKAPIFDSGYYWQPDNEVIANQYYNVIFANYGNSDEYMWYPGMNPYFDEPFDPNNISVSPNGDGYMDYFVDIYVSLLRNAATLNFTYTDANTGEVYFDELIENVNKTYYMPNYGQIIPYVYSWYSYPYYFTDAEGKVLPQGTELTFSISATLDYDAHESNNLSDNWTMPITIDSVGPELISSTSYKDETTGQYFMEITMKDDVAVAAVNILNKAGTAVLAQLPVDKVAHGEEVTMTYDVTGYGEDLLVILGDYAFNEAAYLLEVDGNEPQVDETLLYGYRVYDANYYDDSLYGWIGIDPETAGVKVCSSEYYMDYALVAAANVGGYIVAVDANDDLLAIKPGYWDERTKITSLGTTVNQLAFDPSTETLYGYDKDNYALVSIDIVTGEITPISTGYFSGVNAMACTDDGVLYGIDGSGRLKTINTETGAFNSEVILSTNLRPYYAQSMTYDVDTNSLFWAFYSYSGDIGTLHQIDLTANTITKIGTIGGKAEVVGLLTLDEKEFVLPEVTLESIATDTELVTLLVGGKQTVNVLKTPWYAEAEDYVWSSADENVAVVDENGSIKATGVGTTTVTVTTEDNKYSATCTVKVVNPQSELYAFSMISDTTYNQWLKFTANRPGAVEVLSEGDFVTFYAGEYVDGYVYAYSASGELYKVDATTFAKTKLSNDVCEGNSYIGDMSFDYSTGFMYGFHMDEYGSTNLVVIDTMTGNFEVVAEGLVNEYGTPMLSLAVDTDGTMYMLSMEGLLYTYDVETEVLTKVGYTGYAASSMTQCLAIDHNTGELYWTMLGNTASLMYVDKTTGTALPLGGVDGMSQIVALYAVPKTVPERPVVAVESFTASVDSISLLENAVVSIPVSVKPFNATDRNVTWTVADSTVAAVENGMIVGKAAGTTTITGTVADLTVTIEVEVIASTGALTGYVLSDLADGSGQFWGNFLDYDLSSGEGLAMGDTYMMYAGEYYDGKIYGYGPDYDTWAYSFYVIDRETFAVEKAIACASDAPDVVEMAFDYSTGTMYAVAGTQNVMGSNALYMIDITDGSFYKVADLPTQMMTLACTEAGEMYGVDVEGYLYQIDKATGALTEVGNTGYYANQYQSMAYDYDTGNMYWAQVYHDNWSWSTTTALLLVDVTDASVVDLGVIGTMGCDVTALHIVPEKTVEVGTPEVTGIMLSKTTELLAVGDTFTLTAKFAPISVVEVTGEMTYTSDNTAVATVDAAGKVTAVGTGKAVITATCGDVSATCTVNVAGVDTELYIVNPNGIEASPLLDPTTISSTITLPTEAGLEIAEACFAQDGYIYAVDAAGDLWKLTKDMVQIEKIGNITSQLEYSENFLDGETDVVICDLEANAFSGKVYALVGYVGYWSEDYIIYEIDTTTAAGTAAMMVDYSVGRPGDIAFLSATDVALYDTYQDYVYKADVTNLQSAVTQLAFVQFTVSSGDYLSMTYSKDLNYLFIATDDWYHGDGTMGLYKLNVENGIIAKVDDAAYNAETMSIFMIEGVTPAVGVEKETEEIESPVAVAEEVTEVVEAEVETEETTEVVETEAATEEATEAVEESEVTTEEATEVVEDSETTEITE